MDGSPPSEHFPPSRYDVSLFKDVDYYGKKRTKVGKIPTDKKKKSGKKRKNSEITQPKTTALK